MENHSILKWITTRGSNLSKWLLQRFHTCKPMKSERQISKTRPVLTVMTCLISYIGVKNAHCLIITEVCHKPEYWLTEQLPVVKSVNLTQSPIIKSRQANYQERICLRL